MKTFFDEDLSEGGLFVDLVEVGAVDQFSRLLGDCTGEGGIAVAEGAGGKPGTKIEIAVSFFIPEQSSLSPDRCDGKLSIGRKNVTSELVGGGHGRGY